MAKSSNHEDLFKEFERFFPSRWTRITHCRDDVDLQTLHSLEIAKQKHFKNCSPCPECGKAIEQLSWLYYLDTEHSSPLQGGWMTVCDQDEKVVDFFIERQEFYPWEIVEAARNKEARFSGVPQGSKPCPKCKRSHDQMSWLWFESPEEDWHALAGRAGWLSICDTCHIQVEFLVMLMS